MSDNGTGSDLASHNTPFMVNDWLVDPGASRLQRGEDTIRLEPKVMAVLVLLAKFPGKVLTREELEQSIWAGTVVGYDALTNATQKLRKAFQDSSRNPQYIETVSKKGYRLVAMVYSVDESGHPVPASRGQHQADNVDSGKVRKYQFVVVAGLLVLLVMAVWVASREMDADSGLPTSANPSIAVLPFDNLSNQPDQLYFADGLTDDLITDLTKISSLLVISRDSTFFYRGQQTDFLQVMQDLGARYVLHGSVRRIGQRVRVNAQLTDVLTGKHLWAERYDEEIQDIFRLQDQITQKIVTALALKLSPAERQYLVQRNTENVLAYETFLRGTEQFFRYARESNRKARKLFKKAITLDPRFARAYVMLAWTYTFAFMNGWADKPDENLMLGERFATKALELERVLPVAHFVRGLVYRERGEYVKALVESEKAITLDPNYANGHVLQATLLYYAGRPEEGLEEMLKAIQLNPHHPHNYPFHLGQAYFVLRRYDEAIAAFNNGLLSNPTSERLRVWLAAAYAHDDKINEAKWQMQQVLMVNPGFSIKRQKKAFPFKNSTDLEHFISGIKKAGT